MDSGNGVLYREIAGLGYDGGISQLRAYLRTLKPAQTAEPLVRFETDIRSLIVEWRLRSENSRSSIAMAHEKPIGPITVFDDCKPTFNGRMGATAVG